MNLTQALSPLARDATSWHVENDDAPLLTDLGTSTGISFTIAVRRQ